MQIVIIGAGGHGRVVLDILRAGNRDEAVAFLDADKSLADNRVDGLSVWGSLDKLPNIKKWGITGAVVAIGDNDVRWRIAHTWSSGRPGLIRALHPSANIASNVILGRNVVIAAGALVCTHCQIADSVILNTGCIVDHESVIGEAAHICPGARLAGRVTVGKRAFIGIGATIIQNVTVGPDAIVGAGAVVLRDVPAGVTVTGCPAKFLRVNREE